MKFQFDARQDHQVEAVAAVADLLRGQPFVPPQVSFELGAGGAAIPNRLDLGEAELLANLRSVQVRHGIHPASALDGLGAETDTAHGRREVRFPNFSVEMETGTGKTYVYLRTALRLAQAYGLRKFIVVVPSVAVREGVLGTLRSTREHFRALFGNVPYRFCRYDSAQLARLRSFALSEDVELMVMTLDAFNKAANVIRQSTDRLQGEVPLHLIQAVRPVLILDEPQNMESPQSVEALASLCPLLALRYSATHRRAYNVVYRLTPFEAYRRGLVKKIEVASMSQAQGGATSFVRLLGLESQKRTVRARIVAHTLDRGGNVREKALTVKPGDDLQAKTGRSEYEGYRVEEISLATHTLRFSNGVELGVGETSGADKTALWDAMIRYTVGEHLRKQEQLRPQGIKVLSLFFIDRVAHYVPEDGVIRRLFRRAFLEARERYPAWKDVDPDRVQAGYFAQQQRRGGETEVVESSGDGKADEAAFDLIMRSKERLLSFDEPAAFVFSHSALREGWDNPNVFQVCTLNQAVSETRRRQEVGRGVRLAVNQQGERVQGEQAGVLTVVASEAYERYVAGLQSEIALEYRAEIEARYCGALGELTESERAEVAAEFGAGVLPPPPADARARGEARLPGEPTPGPEFGKLWRRVAARTRYHVAVDSERLLRDALPEIDAVRVGPPPPHITLTRARVVEDQGSFRAQQTRAAETVVPLGPAEAPPHLLALLEERMERTPPAVRLTRQTLLEVCRRTTNRDAAHLNPQAFADGAVRILKNKLMDQLSAGICYQKKGTWYEMKVLGDVISHWPDCPETAESRTGREFLRAVEARGDVTLLLRLPHGFTVPTPLGEYHPEWAVVLEPRDVYGHPTGEELLCLVRGTGDAPEPDGAGAQRTAQGAVEGGVQGAALRGSGEALSGNLAPAARGPELP